MRGQDKHPRTGRGLRLSLAATCALSWGVVGGCPGGSGVLPNLFSGATPTIFSGGGQAGGSDETAGTDAPPVESDPAAAADVVQATPGTVAFATDESGSIAQIIDDGGGVHEFVVFTDESGQEYPAEYRYESDAARLVVTADPDGYIETIDVYDAATGSWAQLALSWSDSTHALVNMTTSADSSIVAYEVALDAPLLTARTVGADAEPIPPRKRRPRAQPTEEQVLSLPVKIKYQDQDGNAVSGLRTTFRLRALDNSATFGVARGDEIGPAGQYLALIPAYRYRRVAGDYPEWKPTFDWGVYTVSAVSLILVTLPLSAPVQAGIAVAGYVGSTLLPGVVDRVMSGEYSDAPYPTALGQAVDYFQVRVSASDRKHTTVISGPISYDDLYETYVEPREFLDLGTVTVEADFAQPARGYRLYRVTQIGSNGQIEVLPEGSENEDIPLCGFEGGGLDCTVMAELQPMSAAFPTEEEAVRTLCDDVTQIKILPLGVGPGVRFDNSGSHDLADWTLVSYEVYSILSDCAG